MRIAGIKRSTATAKRRELVAMERRATQQRRWKKSHTNRISLTHNGEPTLLLAISRRYSTLASITITLCKCVCVYDSLFRPICSLNYVIRLQGVLSAGNQKTQSQTYHIYNIYIHWILRWTAPTRARVHLHTNGEKTWRENKKIKNKTRQNKCKRRDAKCATTTDERKKKWILLCERHPVACDDVELTSECDNNASNRT